VGFAVTAPLPRGTAAVVSFMQTRRVAVLDPPNPLAVATRVKRVRQDRCRPFPTQRRRAFVLAYAQLPDDVLYDTTLSASARLLYAILDRRAGERGWFYDSQEDLASAAGLSVRTVRSALAQLIARGLVSTERHVPDRHVTTYLVAARIAGRSGKDCLPTGKNCRSEAVAPISPNKRLKKPPQRASARSSFGSDSSKFDRVVKREWP